MRRFLFAIALNLTLLLPVQAADEVLGIPILFATDRQLQISDNSELKYTKQIPNTDPMPAGKTININYGIKTINLPEAAAVDLEHAYSKYGWHRPETQVSEEWRNKTLGEDAFFQQIKGLSQNLYEPAVVIVYVNGCCQDYKASMEAAHRVSSTFRAPVVLYSWASIPNTVLNYIPNEEAADNGADRFAAFMERLENEVGAPKIGLIGHSMGNRLIDSYLNHRRTVEPLKFVAFACADVNADKFGPPHEQRISIATNKSWVFFNNSDEALWLSKGLHGKYDRLGAPHTLLAKLINTDRVDFVDHNPLNGRSHDLPIKFMAPICLLQSDWQTSVEQSDTHLYKAKKTKRK